MTNIRVFISKPYLITNKSQLTLGNCQVCELIVSDILLNAAFKFSFVEMKFCKVVNYTPTGVSEDVH